MWPPDVTATRRRKKSARLRTFFLSFANLSQEVTSLETIYTVLKSSVRSRAGLDAYSAVPDQTGVSATVHVSQSDATGYKRR